MPPTTRNSTKQATLEDVGAGNGKAATSAQRKPVGKKRKAESKTEGAQTEPKKSKKASAADSDDGERDEGVITINRAPVLELFASCVAQTLYPSLQFDTCLSIGSAIATITAISKGRSIGKMDKPNPSEAQEKRQKRKEAAEKQDLEEVEVMSFHLDLDKDKHAMVSGKPKKPNEDALKKKYGGPEQYNEVKAVFQDSLKAWKGKEEELDKQAFGFYEDFRPSIPPGQKGWGRKGQLRLETVRSVVGG